MYLIYTMESKKDEINKQELKRFQQWHIHHPTFMYLAGKKSQTIANFQGKMVSYVGRNKHVSFEHK